MTPPSAAADVGAPLTCLAACPVAEFERCVLAGGENTLHLLAALETNTLRELPGVQLVHEGALDAMAWAPEPSGGQLLFAAASSSTSRLTIHHLSPGTAEAPYSDALTLPTHARSCCFLQRGSDRLALAGDGCACVVAALNASAGTASAAATGSASAAAPAAAVVEDRRYRLGARGAFRLDWRDVDGRRRVTCEL